MSTSDATAEARRALHTLDRLVGTWTVDGAPVRTGTVRYAWMEGDAFLVQTVDLIADGEPTRGVEYIGWDPESHTLRSHYFGQLGRDLGVHLRPDRRYLDHLVRRPRLPGQVRRHLRRQRESQHRGLAVARRRVRVEHDPHRDGRRGGAS